MFLYIFLSITLTYTPMLLLLFFQISVHGVPSNVVLRIVWPCMCVCALLFLHNYCLFVSLLLKRIAHFAYTQFSCFVRVFQSIFSRDCLVPYSDVLLILLLFIVVFFLFFFIISHSDTMHTLYARSNKFIYTHTHTHSYSTYARTLFIRFPFRFLSLIHFVLKLCACTYIHSGWEQRSE